MSILYTGILGTIPRSEDDIYSVDTFIEIMKQIGIYRDCENSTDLLKCLLEISGAEMFNGNKRQRINKYGDFIVTDGKKTKKRSKKRSRKKSKKRSKKRSKRKSKK